MTEHSTPSADARTPRYRSSAAARMVNIPVATLRVWERRYQIVAPEQAASGHRLYSSQDIRRLVLIKQLVNRGHAIGMLARMQTPQLQDLLHEAEQAESVLPLSDKPVRKGVSALPTMLTAALDVPSRLRVLLVGGDAGMRWRATLDAVPELDVVGTLDVRPQSELQLQHLSADMVVADLGALHMETVDWLVRVTKLVNARQMCVIYGFANSQVLEALRARGVILRRSPLPPDELSRALVDTVRGWQSVAEALRTLPDPAPPPRFGGADLVNLSQTLPRVACECPQHLAELVTMLGQFEAYSADCESRQPADVALHAYLYRVAGHARALMEDALTTVARAEGVALPERLVSGKG